MYKDHWNLELFKDSADVSALADAFDDAIGDLRYQLYETFFNVWLPQSMENGISNWERILRILPNLATQTLDERRDTAHFRFNNRPPFTISWLNQQIVDIFGSGYADVDSVRGGIIINFPLPGGQPWPDDDFDFDEPQMIPQLMDNLTFFEAIIPMNLGIYFEGSWKAEEKEHGVYSGGELFLIEEIVLENFMEREPVDLKSEFVGGGEIFKIETITLPDMTNDRREFIVNCSLSGVRVVERATGNIYPVCVKSITKRNLVRLLGDRTSQIKFTPRDSYDKFTTIRFNEIRGEHE